MRIAAGFARAATVLVCVIVGFACGEQRAPETPGQGSEEHAAVRAEKAVEEAARELAREVEEHGVVGTVEEGAEVIKENVERSGRVMQETYQEERAEGVGRVQAAGDAYEEVLEIPKKKAGAEEEEKKDSTDARESE